MSASRKKKIRKEQDSLKEQEPKKKTKKLSEGWIFAICMVAIVIVVFGGMFIYKNSQANKTVLTVGDHDVEVREFNYFYRELAAGCDSYSQYIGIEKDVPLNQQKVEEKDLGMLPMLGISTDCLKDLEPVDGVYDYTWAQLVAYNAMRNAASTYAVYQEAVKAGYELSEEDKASIDEALEMVALYADQNNMSTSDYLSRVFGNGCNEKNYRQYLEVVNTANRYPTTLEYTDEERAARYDKEPEKFDTADFYYYSASASAFEPVKDENADEEEKAEEKPEEDYDAMAKAAAEKMAEKFDTADIKVRIYADITEDQMSGEGGMIRSTEEERTWIFKDAKEGEVRMFTVEPEAEDGENLYVVVKMISRGSYNTSNYLDIAIPADAEDKEPAEGEKTAKEKVEAIEESLKADGSEENFRKNVREYMAHEGNDGVEHDAEKESLIENLSHGRMSGISNEFYEWATSDAHNENKWIKVESAGTTHFYFYLGEGEDHQKLVLSGALKQEWFQSITEAAMNECAYDEAAAMKAKVGFYA